MTDDAADPSADAPAPPRDAAAAPAPADAPHPGDRAATAGLEPALEWDPEENVPFRTPNLVLLVLGVLALVAGFLLLPRVNADASNWEGTASPLLLLSGYLLVFLGIILVIEPASPRDEHHD